MQGKSDESDFRLEDFCVERKDAILKMIAEWLKENWHESKGKDAWSIPLYVTEMDHPEFSVQISESTR